jgi:hypothetical protein
VTDKPSSPPSQGEAPSRQEALNALDIARGFGGTGLDVPFATLRAFIDSTPPPTQAPVSTLRADLGALADELPSRRYGEKLRALIAKHYGESK